jgi:hypothetical protein
MILAWVWGQGERQHGVGTHLWLRRHEVPRTMNGTGYSGQVPVKVICGVHFRGVGSFGSRRNNGLYLTQALYHHSNSIEKWHFHPINQKVWQDTVIPTRPSTGGLDASEQSLPIQPPRPQLAPEKRASRLEILLDPLVTCMQDRDRPRYQLLAAVCPKETKVPENQVEILTNGVIAEQ